ncbi:MAG: polysaccharide deacetylase family protein [Gammaproteobacteria bacterium]|nr:polysaccharide deacetylase family protein [Gammaproteobacteria bacterium]
MLKKALYSGAGMLGLWRLTRQLTRDVPRIFMLHRFSAMPDAQHTGADELRRFIHVVGRECEFVTMRECMARRTNGSTSSRPLAVLTVDDGYADFHAVALPILREQGVAATVYATAGFIDGQCWLWWDALRHLIDAHPDGDLRLAIDSGHMTMNIGDAASRQRAWNDIADRLVSRNELRPAVLAQLEAMSGTKLPGQPPPEYAAMNWSQLAELEQAGIEIGGHTMTHAFLPSLTPEMLRHEIHGAKALLEQQLREPLQTFAYPNGMAADHSPAVEKALSDAGFSAAVLAYPRPYDAQQPYRVGRWSAHPDSPTVGHIISGASELKLRVTS